MQAKRPLANFLILTTVDFSLEQVRGLSTYQQSLTGTFAPAISVFFLAVLSHGTKGVDVRYVLRLHPALFTTFH